MRTLKDQLKKWEEAKQPKAAAARKRKKRNRKNRQQEHQVIHKERFSTRDIEELMGTRMPIYERRRGAIKRK